MRLAAGLNEPTESGLERLQFAAQGVALGAFPQLFVGDSRQVRSQAASSEAVVAMRSYDTMMAKK
jgi:hypothetical protein